MALERAARESSMGRVMAERSEVERHVELAGAGGREVGRQRQKEEVGRARPSEKRE